MSKRALPLLAIVSIRSALGCSIWIAAPVFVVFCVLIVAADAILFRPIKRPPAPTDRELKRVASGNGLGIQNWRSLGGIPTASGRKVKEGAAYRSCEIEGVTTSGLAGNVKPATTFPPTIKTVVDIRSKQESSDAPDRVGPESRVVRIPLNPLRRSEASALRIDKRMDIARLLVLHPSTVFRPPDGCPSIDEMPFLTVSRVLAEPNLGDGAVRRIIKLASDPSNHPILWHCATGKDRTGAITAALLLALGVSREEVVRDFLLSNHSELKTMTKRYHLIKLVWLLTGSWVGFLLFGGRLRDVLLVQRKTMECAMARVDNEYGGFHGPAYWKAQGLAEDDLEQLREAMLA